MSSETLEIRMQLRTIEIPVSKENTSTRTTNPFPITFTFTQTFTLTFTFKSSKRSNLQINIERKRNHESSSHYGSNYPAVKATRTLSLPSFVNPPVTTLVIKEIKLKKDLKRPFLPESG